MNAKMAVAWVLAAGMCMAGVRGQEVETVSALGTVKTPVSDASWLTEKTASGSGDGTIVYDVAANAGVYPRTGTITVAGDGLARTFTAIPRGTPEVRNVTAAQRWPWNGKMDIRYEVVGVVPTDYWPVVTATDLESHQTYKAEPAALSGDTGVEEGAHHVVWDLDKQGLAIQSSNVTFTVAYGYGGHSLYCVVDLSAGANAASYPVMEMNAPPDGGFNTGEYKTTKLVLRRIDPGTFTMGSPSGESGRWDNETQHTVTLTKPYYIGLFEVTQKQYELVTGSNPSNWKIDKRPVEKVSWNTIRGNGGWPSSSAVSEDSFMGRLRARTGLGDFDLPTEAQWEYACRAGTTTAYSYGDIVNGDYMWYDENSGWETHDVGTKKPNPWGLYDMHGNVWEWCLDWSGSYGTEAVSDPKGASSGSFRVLRGGSWLRSAANCRSASRGGDYPSAAGSNVGFRLSRILSE